jgi:hypothetical protein
MRSGITPQDSTQFRLEITPKDFTHCRVESPDRILPTSAQDYSNRTAFTRNKITSGCNHSSLPLFQRLQDTRLHLQQARQWLRFAVRTVRVGVLYVQFIRTFQANSPDLQRTAKEPNYSQYCSKDKKMERTWDWVEQSEMELSMENVPFLTRRNLPQQGWKKIYI